MNILGTILETAASILKIGRGAFATKLEEAAAEIRAGRLIPDEAFQRAIDDQELLDELYGRKGRVLVVGPSK